VVALLLNKGTKQYVQVTDIVFFVSEALCGNIPLDRDHTSKRRTPREGYLIARRFWVATIEPPLFFTSLFSNAASETSDFKEDA